MLRIFQTKPDDAIDEILRDPRYRNDSIFQQISNWFDTKEPEPEPEPQQAIEQNDLPDVEIPDFTPAETGGSSLLLVILLVTLIVLIAIIAIFWRYKKSLSSEDEKTLDETTKVYTTRDEWLKLAEEAELKQDHEKAVYFRFKGLIAGLSERSEVPDSDALTTGEYRNHVKGTKKRIINFNQATDKLEKIRYGGNRATQQDSELLRMQDELILSDKVSAESKEL